MNFLLVLPFLQFIHITIANGLPENKTVREAAQISPIKLNLTSPKVEKLEKGVKSLVTVCEEICVHNGKTGWFFSIWDVQLAGVYEDSDCKCTCPIPVREEAHVEICRRPNECDNLCKSNQFHNYSLGGSCRGSDTCVCKCAVVEEYNSKKTWFLRDSPYFEYGIHDHDLNGVNDFEEDKDSNGIPDNEEDEREGPSEEVDINFWDNDAEEFNHEESFFKTPVVRAWVESGVILMIIGGAVMGGSAAAFALSYKAPEAFSYITKELIDCFNSYMPNDVQVLEFIETWGLGPVVDFGIEVFESTNLPAIFDMLGQYSFNSAVSEQQLDYSAYDLPLPSVSSSNVTTVRPYSSSPQPYYPRSNSTRIHYSAPDFGSYGSSSEFVAYNYPYTNYRRPFY